MEHKPEHRRAKKKPSSRHKTSAKTSGALVPQPHGGALSPGNPGNKGGPGRPPSLIRGELRGSYDERKAFLDRVIEGEVMTHMKFRVSDLAQHVTCGNCGESQLLPKNVDSLYLEIDVKTSASVKDRISALEHQAKYSLGQLKEISVENVREKLERQVELLRNRFSGEVLNTLLRELREIWNS